MGQEHPIEEPPEAPFGSPREFAGGRVRLYGCSPVWIIAALIVSVLISCILTALVNAL